MAQQNINIGSTPNDGTGDDLRTSFTKTNTNFTELYGSQPSIATNGDFQAYGGTANAITVTSTNAPAPAALVNGQQGRFLATATNTDDTTIAIDGFTEVPVYTITGEELPANYLSTEQDTKYRYFSASGGYVVIYPYANEDTPYMGNYLAVSGTANAIVLTSNNASPIGSLKTGMQFRFKASAQNTGAVTFAIDGLTPVAGTTVTGVACPADYIRNDVETVITYNGTDFTIDRVIERGSNSDGEWVAQADGSIDLIIKGEEVVDINTSSARGGFFTIGGQRDLPKPTTGSNMVFCFSGNGQCGDVGLESNTNIVFSPRYRTVSSGTGITVSYDCFVRAFWY